MLKAFLFLITFLVGVFAGGATVLFYYPFWFPPAEVNEQVMDLAAGRASGDDSLRERSGQLIKRSYVVDVGTRPEHQNEVGLSVRR